MKEISADALLFIEVKDKVYKYQITHAVTTIGSAQENLVRIKDPSISPFHCIISYVDGHFYVRRLGDAPVHIQDEVLESYSEEIRYSDLLRIGDVRIRLVKGGSLSDVALLLVVYHAGRDEERDWGVFCTRKTIVKIGGMEGGLLLPLMHEAVATLENYGAYAQYVVPAEGKRVLLNDEVVTGRKRLYDMDVLSAYSFAIRVRLLSHLALENPEAILWSEALRRLLVPKER
jgi:hypothetical protein